MDSPQVPNRKVMLDLIKYPITNNSIPALNDGSIQQCLLKKERKERQKREGGERRQQRGKNKKIFSGRTKGQNGACLISFKDFIH